ncbi:MAG: DNA alkylation repair protein [Acidobacteria bacterium]|nr:DNA alkylation repair protein [Acidobacteriota bacterium]
MLLDAIHLKLREAANPEKAKILQRFFKTGPGGYGAGDVFLGLTVPFLRQVVREFQTLSMDNTLTLLASEVHEERMLALLIWVRQFEKGNTQTKKTIYDTYLQNTRLINNWDLVDASATSIVGGWLFEQTDRSRLTELAVSENLWERRIAMIATFYFIRRNHFDDALTVATQLLSDREDLIHKAVGWMLRETGKRDLAILEGFLQKHYSVMPRTMLRYAIERFPEDRRQHYLKGTL